MILSNKCKGWATIESLTVVAVHTFNHDTDDDSDSCGMFASPVTEASKRTAAMWIRVVVSMAVACDQSVNMLLDTVCNIFATHYILTLCLSSYLWHEEDKSRHKHADKNLNLANYILFRVF